MRKIDDNQFTASILWPYKGKGKNCIFSEKWLISQIYIDGVELKDMNVHNLRENIALVSQVWKLQ